MQASPHHTSGELIIKLASRAERKGRLAHASSWRRRIPAQGVLDCRALLNRICNRVALQNPSAMSGGYHNRSGVDSPGKHNTRTKYSSIVQLSAPVVPIVSHGPIVSYDPVLNHFPLSGGYYNLPLESPGKYSSRVKYSSIHSNHFLAAVPVVSHIPAFHRSSIKGGFQNRPSDSPGKHSTRVKYSTIRPVSVPVAAPVAPIVAYAHPIKGGYYNAPLESPGKYSSRVKYTSQLRGISPASVASSAAAPSPSKASASQAQIDAVKKQCGHIDVVP